jgi:hypothetical protein
MGLGFRVLGFRVFEFRFRTKVRGLGLRVEDLGCRV